MKRPTVHKTHRNQIYQEKKIRKKERKKGLMPARQEPTRLHPESSTSTMRGHDACSVAKDASNGPGVGDGLVATTSRGTPRGLKCHSFPHN